MKRHADSPARLSGDQGSAVVVALMAIVLLSALGAGLIALTNTETTIASNFREGSATDYAAEAAGECAVAEAIKAASWSGVLSGGFSSAFRDGTLTPTSASGATLDLIGMTASLQSASDAAARRGLDNPRWRLFLYRPLSAITRSVDARSYAVAWVADDAAETDNDPLRDTNGVIAVRATAVGRPGSQRTVETILSRSSVGVGILSWREIR